MNLLGFLSLSKKRERIEQLTILLARYSNFTFSQVELKELEQEFKR